MLLGNLCSRKKPKLVLQTSETNEQQNQNSWCTSNALHFFSVDGFDNLCLNTFNFCLHEIIFWRMWLSKINVPFILAVQWNEQRAVSIFFFLGGGGIVTWLIGKIIFYLCYLSSLTVSLVLMSIQPLVQLKHWAGTSNLIVAGILRASAGCVSRHLPSLHVDPRICRLVRWLSHVWPSPSALYLCSLPDGCLLTPSYGSYVCVCDRLTNPSKFNRVQ